MSRDREAGMIDVQVVIIVMDMHAPASSVFAVDPPHSSGLFSLGLFVPGSTVSVDVCFLRTRSLPHGLRRWRVEWVLHAMIDKSLLSIYINSCKVTAECADPEGLVRLARCLVGAW